MDKWTGLFKLFSKQQRQKHFATSTENIRLFVNLSLYYNFFEIEEYMYTRCPSPHTAHWPPQAPTPVTDHLGHVRPAAQQPCPSSTEEVALQAVEEGWVAWPPSPSSPFSLPTLCLTVLEQKKKGSLAFQREMNPSQKAEDLRSNLWALSAGRAACWSS